MAIPVRITGLKETILALRRIWTGEFVNFEGEQIHLTNAACTPAPVVPPRIVVGAGSSRRLIRSAVEVERTFLTFWRPFDGIEDAVHLMS